MADLVSDPSDPRLTHGTDDKPAPQADAYLVLPKAERDKGFVRPVRKSYKHTTGRACGTVTTMSDDLAETYARDPHFYGATYCVGCRMHLPVSEFQWDADAEVVGS
jgi:hypothetical protein